MGDGYARASGQTAFVNLHMDSGLANGLSLLTNAADGGTPMVVTSANRDVRKLIEGRADLAKMADPFTKWSGEATHPEQVPGVLRRAFQEAKTPPTGPTYVAFSANALNEDAEVEILPSAKVYGRIGPDPEAIEDAAVALSRASNPVILVGDRVGQSGAAAAAVRVAELLGARVYAASFGEVNFPTGHVLFMGGLGQLFPSTRRMLAAADVVLAVGTNVFAGFFYFQGRALPPATRLIHMDSAFHEVHKSEPTDIGIVADPSVALAALAATIEQRLTEGGRSASRRRTYQAAEERKQRRTVPLGRAERPMSPQHMAHALADVLPKDAIVVDDAITCSGALFDAIEFNQPGSLYGRCGGAIGWGMGGALGVKLAHPERPVVAVVGDGSAMMTVQALWTAAVARIAVVYVVCNNRSYRVLKRNMSSYKREILREAKPVSKHIGTDFPRRLDLAGMAEAMGVRGCTITDSAALGPQLRAAIQSGEPTLIDVIVDGAI
jgi:benzoylformate decarboxylase